MRRIENTDQRVDQRYDEARDRELLESPLSDKRNVVIIGMRNMGADFWTGSKWSPEYPDAFLYTAGEAFKVIATFAADDGEVAAIADFGLTTERMIATTEDGPF